MSTSPSEPAPRVRPLRPDDHAAVLALNEASVELLAPMDAERLAGIVALARHALVAEVDGVVAAAVLAVGPGTAYDSANYRWHDARLDEHTYLDRIVVDDRFRRRGLASLLYDEVERDGVVSLEVYVDPPNEASLAFHDARGYREVGRVVQPDGKMSVMLVRPAAAS